VKLAEALSLRADATRRVEQLRTRIVANARFQEGEEPTEDAAALLAEAGAVLDELEGLIRRINRTNAVTQIGPDVSTATEYPTSMPHLKFVLNTLPVSPGSRRRSWSR
jgi:hypothetical protein